MVKSDGNLPCEDSKASVWDKLRTHADKVLGASIETAKRTTALRDRLVGADGGKEGAETEDEAAGVVISIHQLLSDIEHQLAKINCDINAIE